MPKPRYEPVAKLGLKSYNIKIKKEVWTLFKETYAPFGESINKIVEALMYLFSQDPGIRSQVKAYLEGKL